MGLTDEGFTPKSITDIREDIGDNLKLALGSDIDTTPSSRIGQFIDVVSQEISLTWLGLQDTYNSFFPDTSSGTSLDNVVAITNTARKGATSSASDIWIGGDDATIIDSGSLVQKTGTDERFAIVSDQTIIDTTNVIIVEEVPDAGSIVLSWEAEAIAAINWNDDAATIKATVEGHSKITTVTVLGTLFENGVFHITFDSDTLTSRLVTIDTNTLTRAAVAVDASGSFSTATEAEVVAVNTGAVVVPLRSLTTIATPVLGWNEVVNYTAGVTGTNRETDAELRDRREEELQKSGSSTLNGMKQSIEVISGVINATLVENDTSIVDGDGRDPHSIECYVSGGDDDEVAQAIYDSKPIGIGIVTTVAAPSQRTGNIVDVNGEDQVIIFSEPISIPMLVVVTGTKDINYPVDGDAQIENALLAHFGAFELGEDVLNHLLYTPVNTVPGIVTVVITQDTVAGGAPATGNTVIPISEVATLDIGDITITMV